ncbi:response regulator transcription factor [Consotaella salsifontis]|nr:response regulator transcription factor [Consotaella salsifontis]
MHILVVEDAEDLADAVVSHLRKRGYAVDWVAEGAAAAELLATETYQLVILDLMLPGIDGQTLLRQMRRAADATPVLVITARSQVDCVINVLDIGADDYMVKPFDLGELEARCRALLRRPHGQTSSTITLGNLALDVAARRIRINDQPVDLGAREFGLLEILLGNLGRVMSKNALIDQLFSLDQAVAPNAIELYVSRLRRKLENASVAIRTVHGMGYVAEKKPE